MKSYYELERDYYELQIEYAKLKNILEELSIRVSKLENGESNDCSCKDKWNDFNNYKSTTNSSITNLTNRIDNIDNSISIIIDDVNDIENDLEENYYTTKQIEDNYYDKQYINDNVVLTSNEDWIKTTNLLYYLMLDNNTLTLTVNMNIDGDLYSNYISCNSLYTNSISIDNDKILYDNNLTDSYGNNYITIGKDDNSTASYVDIKCNNNISEFSNIYTDSILFSNANCTMSYEYNDEPDEEVKIASATISKIIYEIPQ